MEMQKLSSNCCKTHPANYVKNCQYDNVRQTEEQKQQSQAQQHKQQQQKTQSENKEKKIFVNIMRFANDIEQLQQQQQLENKYNNYNNNNNRLMKQYNSEQECCLFKIDVDAHNNNMDLIQQRCPTTTTSPSAAINKKSAFTTCPANKNFKYIKHQQSNNNNNPIKSVIYQYKRNNNIQKQKMNKITCWSIYTNFCCLLLKYAQEQQQTQQKNKSKTIRTTTSNKFRLLPQLGASSFMTLFVFLCLELLLLSTVSDCAKTFYMHWNTSNSIFRIDNTDHIIDVNKGNLAFEYDQVHIICPVYEPGTYENETEKYIIYNVSKVEYETCRITNADPRVIAICDKPQKLMFFTITFRPFTPQPDGLEFLPGNDYYFISTSSKDDLYRRIGGRCSTNNMKVVFKVCCAREENKTTTSSSTITGSNSSNTLGSHIDNNSADNSNINHHHDETSIINQQQHHHHHQQQQHQVINNINTGLMPSVGIGGSAGTSSGVSGGKLKPNVGGTSIDQFNRIPLQPNQGGSVNVIGNNIGDVNLGTHHLGGGILLTPGHGGINMIPSGGVGQVGGGGLGPYGGLGLGGHPGTSGGIRINNVPTHKNHDDHRFDKHPNEVVKNEELTYNSAATTTIGGKPFWLQAILYMLMRAMNIYATITKHFMLNAATIFSVTAACVISRVLYQYSYYYLPQYKLSKTKNSHKIKQKAR